MADKMVSGMILTETEMLNGIKLTGRRDGELDEAHQKRK